MRPSNPELQQKIIQKTLEMLMEKEPSAIGMREIATACGVTPPSIYHYFTDKETLFQGVSLFCLDDLKNCMLTYIQKQSDPKKQARAALEAFRDWCFKNQRMAFLIMGKIKVAESMTAQDAEPFYICNRIGEEILKKCTVNGKPASENPTLDTGILVSALWGCIEQTLLRRTDPYYWDKGIEFTDRFLDLAEKAYFN